MASYDVWLRGPPQRRLGFWVNHADKEEARRIAASLAEVEPAAIGLVLPDGAR